MAGIFGFLNFEKEGPGIEKDAPKKRPTIVFIETYFRNFWKFLNINFIFSILMLPMITSGFAAVGITNVSRNIARDKHSFGLSDFFETIKKNWKQALAVGIINSVIYVLVLFATYFYFVSEGMWATIGLGICFAILFIFSMMNMYIWTMMITFSFSIKQLYKNSYKFAIINLFRNAFCLLVLLLVHAFYVLILYIAFKSSAKAFFASIVILFTIYVLTFPSFKYLLTQYITFPTIKKYIIDPYYKSHPFEDIEKRRALGLDIEEEEEEDDEEDDETSEEAEETVAPEEDDDEELVFND